MNGALSQLKKAVLKNYSIVESKLNFNKICFSYLSDVTQLAPKQGNSGGGDRQLKLI